MTRPTPKRQIERDTSAFASGGQAKMLGKGDRTVTATQDAAGRQTPGQTTTKSKDNPRFTRGGPKIKGFSISLPAVGGHCAPIHKGR
jgi:hypothetical protein